MNERSWLWLLLIACVPLVCQTATAQSTIFMEQPKRTAMSSQARISHHDLPGGPDGSASEEMMAQRLRELQELHQLQDQVQGLLKDPDFLNKLKTNFSETELRRLREKILQGNGLGGDPQWNKLLDQAVTARKLGDRDIEKLRRWAEKSDNKQTITSNVPPDMTGPQPSSSPAITSAGPRPPPPSTTFTPAEVGKSSLWERLRKETTDWITDHMDGLGGDVVEALTELAATDEGAPLAELLRSVNRAELVDGPLIDKATDLSRHLPDLEELLHEQRGAWDGVHSIFRDAAVPSLRRLGSGPSLPALPEPPSADAGDWGGGATILLALAVLAMLLWQIARWSGSKAGRGEQAEWRLGPWPVSPAAVSTGPELVRAFEYLALLRLGLKASTCHHRELANRLAGQDEGDPARGRHAAEQLADLYEQARYAPAGEPLSPEELADARHALCYLAGVTVA
jgi:hypothetical protein